MTDTCKIILTPKKLENSSVTELIQTKVIADPPLLAWAEPDPLSVNLALDTAGRLHNFKPLVYGQPSWTEILIAARLFLETKAWHIVANGHNSCWWVCLEEVANNGEEVRRSAFPVGSEPAELLESIEEPLD